MATLNCLIKCLHESVLAGKLQFELVLIHQRSLIQVKASTNMFCSIYSIKEVNGEDQFKEEDNSKNNYLSFLLSH